MQTRRPALASLPGAPPALRHRDFALLWAGQSISMLGDGIFNVALPLETLQVDSRPTALAVVLAARIAPTVCLLLLGGVVVDRIPRRFAMLAADAGRGLAVAAIAAGIATGDLHLWALLVMSAVFGIADAFFNPASIAIVPELLPGELLVQGNALTSTSQQVARMLVGPALGGLVIATSGLGSAFALDAVSFAVSAASLLAMTRRPRPARTGHSALADAREGLRYCRSRRWLWLTIVAAGVANLVAFSPLTLLVPLLIRDVLHEGPAVLGLVIAAAGAGGAIASVIAARMGAPRRRMTVMWLGWGVAGLAVAGLGLAPSAWAAGLFVAVNWALLMYGNVLWHSLMQERVPAGLLGRASSMDWLVSFAGSPVGVVVAGLAAGSVGVRAVLLAGGCVAALMALVLLVPGVREPKGRAAAAKTAAARAPAEAQKEGRAVGDA
jgi:MFS family permease